MEESFTTDDFLGGKIKLRQPVDGYRATSDAVLLAAAVFPKKHHTVLDAGTGTGAVGLCLLARCPDITVTGIDIQSAMADLAIANINLNGLSEKMTVATADIRKKHIDGIDAGSFDWVITNPPFILEDQVSPDPVRDVAHRESDCSLAEWIAGCLRYVNARGYFAMIHRADRLPEILSLLYGRLGEIRIIPIWTKEGEPAKRIIVIGRKGVRSPAILTTGLALMHSDGQRTDRAEAIMRHGAGLLF
ncbi:MAG: methyltransferase [Alphaproteobacteria bacterium]|nr:methyltransferase [Alphaproteobacteria bacterium]